MVRDKVEEAEWKGLGVNDHWQQMKGLMIETGQDIRGMTKGPRRHKKHGGVMSRLLKQLGKKRQSTESGRKKTRNRHGRSISRVDKMQKELFLQQRKRNKECANATAESNGSLLPGLWHDSLHVTCGLTACTPGSALGPMLSNKYGKTLPF